jgi:hypothetical protein
MRSALRRLLRLHLRLFLTLLVLLLAAHPVVAQQTDSSHASGTSSGARTRQRIVSLPTSLPKALSESISETLSSSLALPAGSVRTIRNLALPTLGAELLRPPFPLAASIYPALHPAALLESAIRSKLGIRYRFYGTDDSGYDCSGFVWRVFQEAGASFTRMPARDLWQFLPEATPEESRQFGTLVFFNGLGHVGIVRDAYSFYHASRSQGIVLSFFAGYWEKRLTGFRRAPMELPSGQPMMPPPPDSVAAVSSRAR